MQMGLPQQDTNTPASTEAYEAWRGHSCQPNFYANVHGGNSSCPPYAPIATPSYSPVPTPLATNSKGLRRDVTVASVPRPANPHISSTNHGGCIRDRRP